MVKTAPVIQAPEAVQTHVNVTFRVRFVVCFPVCVKTKSSASMRLTLSMFSAQRYV